MKKLGVYIFLFSYINLATAQKSITNQRLIWYVYLQNLKINDRFSLQTEIQERHFIAPVKQSQFLMRSTFKTAIKHNFDFGVGFCYFLTNTDPTLDYDLGTSEVRPYIEFNNRQSFKHVTVLHRYRLESRFFQNTSGKTLTKGFSFGSMRFRYQFGLDILLNKPKEDKHAVKLRIIDEIMLNFGNKIKYNLFDQNRIAVALQYAPIKQVAVEVGYTNWFQQRSSGDNYFNRHILRFTLIQNIALRGKDKKENK